MADTTASNQTLSSQLNMDPHQTAPEELKSFFKKHSKKGAASDAEILDFNNLRLPGLQSIPSHQIGKAFSVFDGSDKEVFCVRNPQGSSRRKETFTLDLDEVGIATRPSCGAYTFQQIPGLVYFPQLLPATTQVELLGRLLHRDLFNPNHKTNLHAHYDVTYPTDCQSHFDRQPDETLQPKSAPHKPLSMKQVLEEKLRWVTLGGQYNWTDKVYPTEAPPRFPIDIASLIHHLFPEMEPQAAIVNLYSPRHTLNMHRDVSEEIDKGLVSISIGCSCIFIIGIENEATHETQKLALRLVSGDVLYMSGESRLAWHGVAKIEDSSCPEYLESWPGSEYPEWFNWLQNKRINLNVRQMRNAEMTEDDYISSRVKVPEVLDSVSRGPVLLGPEEVSDDDGEHTIINYTTLDFLTVTSVEESSEEESN